MPPRFLNISKYELKQYSGSVVDEAVVLLIVLTAFLLIMMPEAGEASLPSAYHMYRVGYLEGSVLSAAESHYLKLIPFTDAYEMMQANSLLEIDAFTTTSRGKIALFSSGTLKGNAALSRLSDLMISVNERLIYEMVVEDSTLDGILLPLRLDVIEEEIDYSSVINTSLSLRKRELFELRSIRPGGGEVEPVFQPGDLGLNLTARSYNASGPVQPAGAGVAGGVVPSEIEVGVPFRNLYRNMMLLSPSILLSILLALSLARERIDRNIENLFAAPLSRLEILLGKSLPYITFMLFFSMIYGLLLSDGFNAVKIAYVFTAISVTMASFSIFSVMVSRSYRELTFVGSFGLSTFFFFIILPNVFSGINVLAFISPLDLVTSIENNAAVSSGDIFLAILPYNFLTLFFLVFTGMCFNAEIMFQNLGVREMFKRFYTNLRKTLENQYAYTILSVSLLVPFIFIVESIMAYLILPLGFFAPVVSILVLAGIEEFAKILPYFYSRMNPVSYGFTAGGSFFLSEKLFNLYLINKVYSYLGGAYSIFLVKGLFLTLSVHVASTTLLAYIVSRERGRVSYAAGFVIAVLFHFTYNMLVIHGVI